MESIKLSLVSDIDQNLIPIEKIGKFLINLQTMVWHCGEFLSDEPFRGRGKPSQQVSKRCTLLMKEATISSFRPELILSDTQTVLTGKTLGEDSLGLCSELLSRVESNKDFGGYIQERIKNSLYRKRIVQDIDSLIPSKNDQMYLEYYYGKELVIRLDPQKKSMIKDILAKTGEETADLIGILSQIRVTQGPKDILLVGPEGKVAIDYPASMEEDLVKYLVRRVPVNIRGIAEIDAEGNIKKLKKISNIEPLEDIRRTRIISGDIEINLKNPLDLHLGYDNDMWVMTNTALGIHASAKDYQRCLNDAEEEFVFIVKDYLDTPDKGLTKDALELKMRLKEMME